MNFIFRLSQKSMTSSTGTFNVFLAGTPISVNYSINGRHECATTFSYMGRPLEFKMTRWSGNGWTNFIQRFYDAHDNSDEFGCVSIGVEELPVFKVTPEQVTSIIVRAARDVFQYVDTLLHEHQKQILDYAVWYRDRNSNPSTYEEYIQLVACHCIVHSQFLAGNVTWNIIPFVVHK